MRCKTHHCVLISCYILISLVPPVYLALPPDLAKGKVEATVPVAGMEVGEGEEVEIGTGMVEENQVERLSQDPWREPGHIQSQATASSRRWAPCPCRGFS